MKTWGEMAEKEKTEAILYAALISVRILEVRNNSWRFDYHFSEEENEEFLSGIILKTLQMFNIPEEEKQTVKSKIEDEIKKLRGNDA